MPHWIPPTPRKITLFALTSTFQSDICCLFLFLSLSPSCLPFSHFTDGSLSHYLSAVSPIFQPVCAFGLFSVVQLLSLSPVPDGMHFLFTLMNINVSIYSAVRYGGVSVDKFVHLKSSMCSRKGLPIEQEVISRYGQVQVLDGTCNSHECIFG